MKSYRRAIALVPYNECTVEGAIRMASKRICVAMVFNLPGVNVA